MENESDERLIERFKIGERAAFDEIARRYRPRLLRFFARRTRNAENAEDLTQETLIKAFASVKELRVGAFFSAWILRIAFRTFVDSTRRRRLDVASFDESGAGGDFERLGDVSSKAFRTSKTTPCRPTGTEFDVASPESRVVRADESDNLWSVAREILTAKEFKALWMRYVDDATDAEAAVALGVSPGAVRVALTRARQKLIARLRTEKRSETDARKNVD